MWVRGVRAIVLFGLCLPSLALAQSNVFRASFTETTESLPTGLTVGDFDLDGAIDVAVTTPDTRVGNMITSAVTILKGAEGGKFFLETKIVVNGYPAAILQAPLDGDAIPDLVVADGNGGSIAFMKGLGNEDFFAPPGPPITVGSLPEDIAAANLDDDGILDLVVANRESSAGNTPGSVSILQGEGDGTFVTVLQHDPTPEDPNRLVSALATDVDTTAVALGDLNNDDFVDIAALNAGSPGSITIFFGDGQLGFGNRTTVPVGTGPADIALEDLDDDGAVDVIIAESFADTDGAVAVLFGNGDGTFQEPRSFQAGNTPNGVAVGDMNGDGHMDIVASNGRSGDVSVLIGDGDGGFAQARTFVADAEPLGLFLEDMDKDGATDVVAITAAESGTAVFARNRGDGSLNAVEDVLVGVAPSSIASGDVNDDAIPDLIVGTSSGNVLIYSALPEAGFNLIRTLDLGGTLRGIVAVDLNGDSVLDLALADSDGNRAVIVMGLGGGQFDTPVSIDVEERPSSIASGDFNADGLVDLAITTFGPEDADPPLPKVTPLLRRPDGTYAVGTPVAVEETPLSVVAADFNGDGRDDVAVANANERSNTVSVLFSNANGSFRLNQTLSPAEVGQQPSSLAVADFNVDGRPDIAVADFLGGISPSTIRIFLTGTDGLLAFDRSLNAGTALEDIAARDITGDSLADLAVVVNTANQVTLFYDQGPAGEGRFRSRPPDNVSRRPINMTVADFNDDGRYDIATGNEDPSANNVSVLTNCVRDQDCSSLTGVRAFRGDGNGDEILSAADLLAVSLEVIDGDGRRIEDIARPEASGYQASPGVDANGDGRVDAQDRTAVVRRLFAS